MAVLSDVAFRRFGRSYHLNIESAKDLEHVLDLDEAHWVATGAPIDTINCDATFLELLDVDDNGRIMCYELIGAIRWVLDVLKDPAGLDEKRGTLKTDALNVEHPDGEKIRLSVRKMLAQLAKPRGRKISLDEVREIKRQVEETPVSEAGVVLEEASEDAEVRAFISDVLSTVGGVPHPSGTDGVNQEKLDRFLEDARATLDWEARAAIPEGASQTDIMPLGEETAAAFAAYAALVDKIDQYFAQCRAVALEPTLAERFGATAAELDAMDLDDPTVISQVLGEAPLATPRAERVLPLIDAVNPHYADALVEVRAKAVAPVLGDAVDTLTESDWERIKGAFAAHADWRDARPAEAVGKLGAETLETYLDERFRSAVAELIAGSVNTAYVLDNIRLTEKLILYQAHLIDFANNFVSFPDLYDEKRRAMFEMGSLVCDGRRFNMAVRVKDRAEHTAVAKTSNLYVMYVLITSRDKTETIEVAIPVTSGGKGNLCVAKRGLFIDVDGLEWDAKVVEIIDNPISLREALVAPFRRVGRALTGKLESITTAAEKKVDVVAAQAVPPVTSGAAPAAAPTPAPEAAKSGGVGAGTLLMGGGVAVAALGSALAYITKTLAGMALWHVLAGIATAVLIVMIPLSIMAFVKLRRRDLSAILEGSGWAINARMRLTRRQARFFTRRPPYPLLAKGIQRRLKWVVIAIIVVVLAAVAAGIRFL